MQRVAKQDENGQNDEKLPHSQRRESMRSARRKKLHTRKGKEEAKQKFVLGFNNIRLSC